MSAVRPRVLLVDDVADLRFLLRVVLESDGGFEVVGEAGDGTTAVELCVRTDPDVIVLDLSMPNMDGLEALPRLRELAPDAKIVVLSAFERGRVSTSAADLGADAYFEKGTPPPAVLDSLKALLGMAPTAAEDTSGVEVLSGDELHALVAHDLRGPLTAIVGFGETLIEHWDQLDDDLRRSMVVKMTIQSRTLQAIAENLLSARSIDMGLLDVNVRPVAPAALLTDLAPSLVPLCGDHHLEVHVSPDLPVVLVDEQRFLQVLVNLVGNAATHAPAKSSIGLEAHADGPWVAVEVRDSGPGIPAAERARVLEKHARLGGDSRGLGLGLFIASTLCRAMGGTLLITDNDGGGTRVVCRLRVAETAG
jgi:signal transduction histidine kinase